MRPPSVGPSIHPSIDPPAKWLARAKAAQPIELMYCMCNPIYTHTIYCPALPYRLGDGAARGRLHACLLSAAAACCCLLLVLCACRMPPLPTLPGLMTAGVVWCGVMCCVGTWGWYMYACMRLVFVCSMMPIPPRQHSIHHDTQPANRAGAAASGGLRVYMWGRLLLLCFWLGAVRHTRGLYLARGHITSECMQTSCPASFVASSSPSDIKEPTPPRMHRNSWLDG